MDRRTRLTAQMQQPAPRVNMNVEIPQDDTLSLEEQKNDGILTTNIDRLQEILQFLTQAQNSKEMSYRMRENMRGTLRVTDHHLSYLGTDNYGDPLWKNPATQGGV